MFVFQPAADPSVHYKSGAQKSVDVPCIVLSDADDDNQGDPDSPEFSPTQYTLRKTSPEVSDQDTSDWMSQSSGSPISSTNDRTQVSKSQEVSPETESLIKDTISEHIREHIVPHEEDMSRAHGSRIPVRLKQSEERAMSSPGRLEQQQEAATNGKDGQAATTRKISVKVQRPRSPNSIMAEARLRQEQEKERKRREKDESERQRREADRDETVYTGSASETGELPQTVVKLIETDPVKSDEDDLVKDLPILSSSPVPTNAGQMNGDVHQVRDGVPVYVMPNKKHDMEVLLEALKHARTEASAQDVLIQASTDQPDFKEIVDKNIEQLEAQLAAVKAQSKQMFEGTDRPSEPEPQARGRAPVREPRRGERRSPPRGILDMMANQHIAPEETVPKERLVENGDAATPPGILRYRSARSPTDHAGKFTREDLTEPSYRPASRSPDRIRTDSPHQKVTKEEKDADKRLIKYLSNEIENLKLKISVLDQKGRQRSPSPYGVGPRITSGLPERDRSPAQISSRARARFSELTPGGLSSYSPLRRGRPLELIERSRSPRFDSSPARSLSRSPARSPSFRSRTPDHLSHDRPRSISPSEALSSDGRLAPDK